VQKGDVKISQIEDFLGIVFENLKFFHMEVKGFYMINNDVLIHRFRTMKFQFTKKSFSGIIILAKRGMFIIFKI